jgi:hypothetical protein
MMDQLTYSQLKGQLLILEQIKNPSQYIIEAIQQIRKELRNLESQNAIFSKIDKATQALELIKQQYPDLLITYSINHKPFSVSKEEKIRPRFKTPINVITHLSALNKDYTFKNPRSIIFNNKEFTGVRYWKDVLEAVCNLMQQFHPQQINRILRLTGSKRLYFATSINQLSSQEAKLSPRKIKNTNIFLETNFSANKHVKTCYDIIELFGHKRNELNFITF